MALVFGVAPALAAATVARLATTGASAIAAPDSAPEQGRVLVFADLSAPGEWDLYVAGTDGRGRARLTATSGLNEGAPAGALRGGSLAYEGTAPGPDATPFTTVFLRDEAGTTRQITGGPADADPSWHPSGEALAFATKFGDVTAIVRTTLATMEEQPLAEMDTSAHALAQPAYSPDGSRIALVVQSSDSGGELWSIAGAGGNARRLLRHPGWDDVHPAWSPDGARLAFASGPWEGERTRHDIWLLDVGTGVVGTLQTDFEYDLNRPAWSPDGQEIVYESRLPGSNQSALYRIPAVGGDPVYLTSGGAPTWWTQSGGPTPTARPTESGPTATVPTPTEGPPFPSLPPPPSTAPAFPTQPLPEPTSTGPAPTFPPPTTTATSSPPTATTTLPSESHRLFLPALPGQEPERPDPTDGAQHHGLRKPRTHWPEGVAHLPRYDAVRLDRGPLIE